MILLARLQEHRVQASRAVPVAHDEAREDAVQVVETHSSTADSQFFRDLAHLIAKVSQIEANTSSNLLVAVVHWHNREADLLRQDAQEINLHLRASSLQLVEDQQHQVEHKDVIDEPSIVQTGLALEHLVDDREKAFWAELLGQVAADLFFPVLEACLDAN